MGHWEAKKTPVRKVIQSKIINIFLLRVIIALCSQLLSIKKKYIWKTSQELAIKMLEKIPTLAIIRHFYNI